MDRRQTNATSKVLRLNTISNFVAPAAGVISAPILAHGLGVQGRGELASIIAPVSLVIAVCTFGLTDSITRYVARNGASRKAVLSTILIGMILTALVACICSVLILRSDVWSDNLSVFVAASMVLAPLTVAVLILRAAFAGAGDWNAVFLEKYLSAGFRVALLVGLLVSSTLGVINSAVVILSTPLLAGLAYLGLFKRGRQGARFGFRTGVAEIGGFGARVWIGSLSGVLLSRLDQLLMVPLSTSSQLGLYAVSVTVSEIVLVLVVSVREVVFAAQSNERSDAALFLASRVCLWLSVLLGGIIGVSAPFWVPFAFGSDFDRAVPIITVLLIGGVLSIPGSILGVGLSAHGLPGRKSLSLVGACAVNAIFVVALVPYFGALGAAWATLVGNLFLSVSTVLFFRRFAKPSCADLFSFRLGDFRLMLSARAGAQSETSHPDGPNPPGPTARQNP